LAGIQRKNIPTAPLHFSSLGYIGMLIYKRGDQNFNGETAIFLTILLIIALVSVAGTLGFGLYTLLQDGELSSNKSNAAMRWRVGLQALALVIFAFLLGGKK
jgi:Hypoxia induced protein conserved region